MLWSCAASDCSAALPSEECHKSAPRVSLLVEVVLLHQSLVPQVVGDVPGLIIQPITLAYTRVNGLPVTRRQLPDLAWFKLLRTTIDVCGSDPSGMRWNIQNPAYLDGV